ncbi:MAG: ATP-binding cassette domain-containing protein [Acidimicrobiia bacterium]|nr:ATP-binding cassette domain-containing protein [Acidimicrobiia bacterium]
MTRGGAEVIALEGVSVVRDGRFLLNNVDWVVHDHERWVVFGPNGAGKTTMLQVASTYLGPTRGRVRLLGEVRGRVDVRVLREQVGYAGPAPAEMVRRDLPAIDIVVTGKHASFVDRRWHEYDDDDVAFAEQQLTRLRSDHLAGRRFGTLSSGEKQRVLIARSLMTHPKVLLLDEAMTGLDLGARERLVASLADLASDPASPAVVLVTHHVEEIPPGFSHIVMMTRGTVLSRGPIGTTLTAAALSECFGQELSLERRDDRYHAWSAGGA